MRDFCERCGVGFRRQKIEAAINLKCIRADNFRAEIARDIGRELGFSGGGRADDKKYVSHKLKGVVAAVSSRNHGLRVRTHASALNKTGDARLHAGLPIEDVASASCRWNMRWKRMLL